MNATTEGRVSMKSDVEKERIRIRRAQRDALRELREWFGPGPAYGPRKFIDIIDLATRATRTKKGRRM
jgi:hypothetical protein